MSIQSEIERLQGVKSGIKNAIVESGIDVPDNTPFAEYANKTSQIIGQFDSKLDEIIGGEIVPMLDVQQRLEAINGVSGDVSTQLDTLDTIKYNIAYSISEKGVEVPEGTPFTDYENLISEIGNMNLANSTLSIKTYHIVLGDESLLEIYPDAIVLHKNAETQALVTSPYYEFFEVPTNPGETLLCAMVFPGEISSTSFDSMTYVIADDNTTYGYMDCMVGDKNYGRIQLYVYTDEMCQFRFGETPSSNTNLLGYDFYCVVIKMVS